jgi:hypothetical protein
MPATECVSGIAGSSAPVTDSTPRIRLMRNTSGRSAVVNSRMPRWRFLNDSSGISVPFGVFSMYRSSADRPDSADMSKHATRGLLKLSRVTDRESALAVKSGCR